MLILSFCFIVTAIVILSLELGRFGNFPQWKVPAAAGS